MTDQEICQHIAAAVLSSGAEDRQAVRIIVARLVVDEVLEIGAELHRMYTLHLRHVVGEVEQVFGSEERRIEAARIEHRRPITPTRDRRNLLQAVLEESFERDV